MSELLGGAGREARFVGLYEATYVDLVRFARRRVVEGAAEDVVEEAFLAAWRRLEEVPREVGEARAWLFGVVWRTILNAERGVRRQRAVAVRLAGSVAECSPDSADFVARRVDLGRAWEQLSAVHQEALALVVVEDLSARQAASVLGITAVAFRLRLSRARHALRAQLDHRRTPRVVPADAIEGQHS
ncbi:RNA polymerase sigma factor [Kribbella sp. NPDC026611]|uniref:RNA polymerase sigma factor n=1 Tax=Kribbella sp. NPDC026611 TaxID=3154911 RepID=UPI0033D07DD8